MKKLFTLFAFLLSISMVKAQITTPAPSPACKFEQKVGLTDITLEYSRPGIKGRDIYGGLVPYGEMWRTGANASTKVSFSTDVKIQGEDLMKGDYALYTIPGEEEWEFIFYKDLSNWGVPQEWNEDDVALRVKGEARNMGQTTVENMLIMIDEISNASAWMILAWERTAVGVKIEVPTNEMVMSSINATMAGPSDRDYYLAASYYFEEGKDMDQALEWINMSLAKGGDKFWVLRRKALIQAAMEDYKGAIETAKKSRDLAKEAGNMNYVNANEESIKEWMEKM